MNGYLLEGDERENEKNGVSEYIFLYRFDFWKSIGLLFKKQSRINKNEKEKP